ncbi:MAG: methyltransferase domain-containing protein [Janthinobacterium lividum]
MDLREDGLLGAGAAGHWYYRAKSDAVAALLGGTRPRSVLDVGAGTGFFSRQLLRRDHVAGATCVDPGYAADRDEWIEGKPLLFRRDPPRADAELVLLMDVLEHVADDGALLGSYVQGAGAGTRFIVTVPAFSWLWSGHDVFLGHHRRYTLGQIRGVVERSGLVVEDACYLYGALFPLAAGSRLLGRLRAALTGRERVRSQMRRCGRLSNGALWAACRAELLMFRRNRLFGLTAMVTARKPA